MDITTRKPRRTETFRERIVRLEAAARDAMERALSEQDAVDAMVRRSIEQHGA